MRFLFLSILISIHISAFAVADTHTTDRSYGVFFHAQSQIKELRTGLHLTSKKKINITQELQIGFDLLLRNEAENFGYVFRLIHENNDFNIDLVANPDLNHTFSLVSGNTTLVKVRRDDLKESVSCWTKIRLSLDRSTGTVLLIVGTRTFRAPQIEIPRGRYDLFFGRNDHPQYFTYEVAPFSLKDVEIWGRKGRKQYHWKLARHEGAYTFDELSNCPAEATNPSWILDDYVKWKKRQTIVVDGICPQTAFDKKHGRVYVVRKDRVYVYFMGNDSVAKICTFNEIPFGNEANCLVYDSNNDRLVTYLMDQGLTSKLDLETLKWSEPRSSQKIRQFWHHNRCPLDEMNAFLVYGGYGESFYSGESILFSHDDSLVRRYNWRREVSPRYLAGLGYMGQNRLLMYGGYGSRSGNRHESPVNSYELFMIDLNVGNISKLGDYGNNRDVYTCSNSMVYDSLAKQVYVLTYDNRRYISQLYLRMLSLPDEHGKHPAPQLVGDSIPYYFNETRSYCDLYHCTATGNLYALTFHLNNADNTEINIYSLRYPPLMLDEYGCQEGKNRAVWLFVILPILVLSAISFRLFKKRWVEKNRVARSADRLTLNVSDESSLRHSSIWLLGGFQVIDKEGQDITRQFTQTLKYMFLMILLETCKTGKGISSRQIEEILWFDKDPESARNNRYVNIRKMRMLLKEIGNISLSKSNSYWHIEMDHTEVFCDYSMIMHLVDRISQSHDGRETVASARILVDLISKGMLLPNIQVTWVDQYKAEFASYVIEALHHICSLPVIAADMQLQMQLLSAILVHDPIDEEAVKEKCRIWISCGKKGLARTFYNTYASEYLRMMGEPPTLTFSEIIKTNVEGNFLKNTDN